MNKESHIARWNEHKFLRDESEYNDRHDTLETERKKEISALEPRLYCCDLAHKYVKSYYDFDENKPGWVIPKTEFNINFCPFCAMSVPEFEYSPIEGLHYMRFSDGGYYCDECSQRLQSCICLTAVCTYRIKNK